MGSEILTANEQYCLMERTGHQRMRMAKALPNGPRNEGTLRLLQSFVVHEDPPATSLAFLKTLSTFYHVSCPLDCARFVHQHVR